MAHGMTVMSARRQAYMEIEQQEDTECMPSNDLYRPIVKQSCCPCCCPKYYFAAPFDFHLPNCCAFVWFFVCKCNMCRKPKMPTQAELDKQFPVMYQPVILLADQPTGSQRAVSVTWLGHAFCLFTFPETGHRVLFDPVFSQRCSPLSFAGPKRYRQPPCGLEQLPLVDAVCISHNHYDHLDIDTLRQLAELQPQALFCVPKGDGPLLNSVACRRVQEMEWWETACLPAKGGQCAEASPDSQSLTIVFTPSKHWSGRLPPFDMNCSLWGSYVLQPGGGDSGGGGCCFFSGDTGYDERLFKQIRGQFGPIKLSAIAIGAYMPRHLLGAQHVSPKEAVYIHKDLDCAKSLGIHWGTFDMGAQEAAMDPAKDLAVERREQGVPEDRFVTVCIGETVFAD